MMSPKVLEDHGIQVKTTYQHENQIVILLPGTFHFGFNLGFNVAEAMNFATDG